VGSNINHTFASGEEATGQRESEAFGAFDCHEPIDCEPTDPDDQTLQLLGTGAELAQGENPSVFLFFHPESKDPP
jgi:hypothetical protein